MYINVSELQFIHVTSANTTAHDIQLELQKKVEFDDDGKRRKKEQIT